MQILRNSQQLSPRASALTLGFALALLACESNHTVAPQASAPRSRVVSQSPALTEILCQLGGGSRLVAVSQHTTHPKDVDALPRLSVLPINLEALNDLDPNLILAQNPSADLLQYCQERGLALENFRIETWAEILAANERMAAIFSLSADKENQRLKDFRDHRAGRPLRGSAVLVISRSPGELASIMSASGGFLSECLQLAGLRNSFADQDRPYPLLNLEAILDRKPDWIIELRGSAPNPSEEAQLLSDWRPTLEGPLQKSRVKVISLSGALIPGPRVTELVEALEAATQEP